MPSEHRWVLQSEMPVPRRQLFEWFARPGAFERLAPPFVHLSGIRREGGLEVGARTSVSVRVGPLRRRFVAEHVAYEEGTRFVDAQVEGPFARFANTHRMLEGPEGHSILEDALQYTLPGGALGELLGEGLVRRKLEAVFGYRHALLQADLLRHQRFA